MRKYLRISIFLLGLLLIVSMGRSTYNLFGKGKSIEDAKERVAKLEKEKELLEETKKIVDSNDFVEKEARDKLGMGREGETILVLPSDEVLKKFAPSFDEERFLEEKPIYRRWIDLFFNFH